MPSQSAKLPIAATCLVLGVVCVIFVARRTTHSEVDSAISSFREAHTCNNCGASFSLSVAEAAAMRRANAGVVCPKCGKIGATKDATFASTELNNNAPPPGANDDEDDTDESSPRASKTARPAGALTPAKPSED